jgi:predicted nucleotidyltransferase
VLPDFTAQGSLPPGIHTGTFAEVSTRYGRFQRTDQRPRLLAVLEEFIGEVRRCRWVRRLLLAGSFVTASEEPHDIDVLLVFEHGAQFTALLPHEYNVLYQGGARRRFGTAIDLHVVEEGSEFMERLLHFFQRDRNGNVVGMVEVIL